jgi:hypothetical protein
MSGFVPLDADAWPMIASVLPRPWPAEAAAFDLRWHADRARMKRGAFPGRPFFVARWGWTDWAVKQLLRSESWVDRFHSASGPPADRQRTASGPPVATTTNAEKSEETASQPPASRQPAASEPPRARSSPLHRTPNTDLEGDGAREAVVEAAAPPPPPPAPPPPKPAPTLDPDDDLAVANRPIRLPGGREVPGNIPALLPRLSAREWNALAYNGVPHSRALLRLTVDQLQHSRGIAGAIATRVVDELRRQRIEPGCLAAPEPRSGAPPGAAPRGPVGTGLAAQMAARRASRDASPHPDAIDTTCEVIHAEPTKSTARP